MPLCACGFDCESWTNPPGVSSPWAHTQKPSAHTKARLRRGGPADLHAIEVSEYVGSEPMVVEIFLGLIDAGRVVQVRDLPQPVISPTVSGKTPRRDFVGIVAWAFVQALQQQLLGLRQILSARIRPSDQHRGESLARGIEPYRKLLIRQGVLNLPSAVRVVNRFVPPSVQGGDPRLSQLVEDRGQTQALVISRELDASRGRITVLIRFALVGCVLAIFCEVV